MIRIEGITKIKKPKLKRIRWIVGGTLLLIAFAIFVAPTIVICVDRAYICEYTASWSGYREWPFGVTSGSWYHPSPLEDYLKAHSRLETKHSWKPVSATGKDIFGRSIMFSDYEPVMVLKLRKAHFSEWIENSEQKSVLDLYDLLCSRDPKADVIIDKISKD